ncbi:4383_t:CDS:2, partial [Acaulospora colombiana]
ATKLGLPRELAFDAGTDATPRVLLSIAILPQLAEIFLDPGNNDQHLPCFHKKNSFNVKRLIPADTTLASHIGTSNVETIELYQARTNGDVLGDLLRLPRALKKFVYQDRGIDEMVLHACPRNKLGRALNHVAHSLEVLEIAWTIKRLCITLSLILGTTPSDAPSLSNVLPPSIETLEIYPSHVRTWEQTDYVNAIRQLLLDKSPTCVPHLHSITYFSVKSLSNSLLDLASERNVALTGPGRP